MSIQSDIAGRDFNSYIESDSVANQPAKAVVNPDGSDIGAGALSKTTDSIANYPGGESIIIGGVAVPVKHQAISVSSSGNNTIVTAVSGKKIRVLGVRLIASGTVNAKFQDGAGGTDLDGLAYLVAGSGYVLPFCAQGWFNDGTTNTLLNLNLSAAVAVGGVLIYAEIP